jgi:hypothetical protein
MSPARRRGQDAAPNRRNDLDRVEHRHTINTGGTAPKPTTNIKINNNSYTENLTGSRDPGLGQDRTDRLDAERLAVGVDVVHDHRSRRSSSAWAKNAAVEPVKFSV